MDRHGRARSDRDHAEENRSRGLCVPEHTNPSALIPLSLRAPPAYPPPTGRGALRITKTADGDLSSRLAALQIKCCVREQLRSVAENRSKWDQRSKTVRGRSSGGEKEQPGSSFFSPVLSGSTFKKGPLRIKKRCAQDQRRKRYGTGSI